MGRWRGAELGMAKATALGVAASGSVAVARIGSGRFGFAGSETGWCTLGWPLVWWLGLEGCRGGQNRLNR